MYIWKTKQLATLIKEEGLTENLRKKYFLVLSVITLLGIYALTLFPNNNLYSIVVEAICVIVITIIGIKTTFSANNGEHGSDYLGRMVALSLPVLIKMLVMGLIVGFFIGIYIGITGDAKIESWSNTILAILLQAWYFWRLNIHLKYINA